MKVQRILVLISFSAVLVMVARSQEAHVYCGRNLALTLAMLCENGMMVKRTPPYYAESNSLAPQGWPWLAPHRARSMERGKRQVAAECCDKPCTMDELLSYCAK